jgi:ABC-type branched-subunit amino acid transport system substrate-binding protein
MRPWPIAFLFLSACATTGVRAQPDGGLLRPPEPRNAPDGSAEARADAEFKTALARVGAGERDRARTDLTVFLERHPEHPAAPRAAAVLGRLALDRGDAAAAKEAAAPFAARSAEPGLAFALGVAESRLGNGRRALELLAPFSTSGAPLLDGDDHEGDMLLRTALADAYALVGNTAGALAEWDRYSGLPGVKDHEKSFARERAEELAGRLTGDAALAAYQASQARLARAALGPKAAAALRARGDGDGARRLEDEAGSLRRSLGFESAPPWLGPGDPSRLGLAVPLSGRLHILGQVALRGAMLAIGEPTPSGEAAPFQLMVRDSAAGGDRPDARTAELVREEAVIGIVGVGDRRALEQTARDGVPYLVLEDQVPGRQSTAFQLLHGPDARAAELARRALAAGARTFAILGPDNQAGQRLAESFKRAVTAGGGRVVAQVSYIAGASSFAPAVTQLRRSSFDALFIPDDADRLELVTPALAVGDLWSRPVGAGKRPPPPPGAPKRREVILLSTAVGLSKRLVKNAGRYVQGALFSPGFSAAGDEPRSAAFVNRFRQLHNNQDPSATDAYAFDGVRLLRAAVERGARTRADVLRALGSESFEGVTGTLKFGPDHGRVDPPLVYTVEGDEIRTFP